MSRLRFADLSWCDIYRDGGSYEANFTTETGGGFVISLEIVYDDRGEHEYGGLYERPLEHVENQPQVPLRGEREQEIVGAVAEILARAPDTTESHERLREMLAMIPGRSGRR
jgi:hypothetical protein